MVVTRPPAAGLLGGEAFVVRMQPVQLFHSVLLGQLHHMASSFPQSGANRIGEVVRIVDEGLKMRVPAYACRNTIGAFRFRGSNKLDGYTNAVFQALWWRECIHGDAYVLLSVSHGSPE